MRQDYHEAETLEADYDAANGEEVKDKINQGKQAKQAREEAEVGVVAGMVDRKKSYWCDKWS